MSRAAKKTLPSLAAPSAVVGLLLTEKAEVKELTLKLAADGSLSAIALQTLLKKKESPELLGTYPYKTHTLSLFGYSKGKVGTENKHELPPPHDSTLCFGDILLIASLTPADWSYPVSFKSAEYETFYTRAFGGFEDLDEEEEGDEEELVEDEVDDEVVEEEDEEPEDEPSEDDEEDDTGGDVGGDADGEDAPIVPILPKKKVAAAAPACAAIPFAAKVKKARKSVASGGAAGVAIPFTGFLHVSEVDELREQWDETPCDRVALCPQRAAVHASLTKLFKGLLTPEEVDRFERCIYNSTIRRATERHVGKAWSHPPFVELYTMQAKTLTANFHPASYVKNTELFDRYKRGEVDFVGICGMDSYQMFEARWRDSFVAQQAQEKRQLEGNKAMATDRFLCTRCWKRECTYYEMQTRSADEPMTIFITCLNCGKHWRQ